jgi:hypothetical protein
MSEIAAATLGTTELDELGTVEVRDGALLHRRVPPQRWCITQKDLEQFRRLVIKLVVDDD